MSYLPIALVVVIVALVWWKKMLTLDGIVAAVVVGVIVYWALDWRGLVLTMVFFPVLAGSASLWGQKKKVALGLKDEASRNWRAVVSNGALPALIALGYAVHKMNSPLVISAQFLDAWFIWVYVGLLAGATADTVSAEMGKLWAPAPLLITTMKPVKAGTNGAVSAEGTLSGLVGSAILALVALSLGFVGFKGFIAAIVVGTFINVLDSYIGATIEGRWKIAGRVVCGNNVTNFMSMLVGGLVACGLWLVAGR
jgi:uncharacterized protein (TIGR00297 family)